MTAHSTTIHKSRLYRVLTALIVPCLIYYGVTAFDVVSSAQSAAPDIGSSPAIALLQDIFLLPATMLVGWLIIRRVPGNTIGPLLIIIGASLGGGTETLGRSGLLQAMAQFFNQSNIAVFALLLFYFPTGRANTPWLELAMIIWALSTPFYALFSLLASSHLNPDTTNTPNPFFVEALSPYSVNVGSAFPIFFLPLLLGLLSLFLRYRIANPHEKQQIKWFVWCTGTILPIFAGWVAASFTPIGFDSWFGKILLFVSSTWFYAMIPLGVGIAILRHKLYDIDIIIRRTLVYSAISVILALVYFGGVAVMQGVFEAITGQESPLAVVASTLAIAALFTPIRRRVQNVVDRRFFRRKYDAEKTVDAFARAARDEVDMDLLRAELVRVVEDTMQPEHVSLWLASERYAEGGPL